VVPKPRFIFDNYKVDETRYSEDEASTETADKLEEQTQMEQRKHDSDYFSFFKSHENIILKPESNFKGLRTFLTHLPIDYYILLQQGYDDKSRENAFARSNYIYCDNIPLLGHKQTYFKKSSPIRTIMLEDVYKCSNRFEAEQLLDDPYAIDEMLRHLSERYGDIEEQFFINYDVDGILNRVGMGPRDAESLAHKGQIE